MLELEVFLEFEASSKLSLYKRVRFRYKEKGRGSFWEEGRA